MNIVAKTYSASVQGIEAEPVEIEASQSSTAVSSGDSGIAIVGLPDTAVKESRERLTSAFGSSQFPGIRKLTVVNLAPADLKKEGASFDLGIALAVLGCCGLVKLPNLQKVGAIGELALDGTLRPVKGILPMADSLAKMPGLRALLVPEENAKEAAVAAGKRLKVYAVKNLNQAVEFINTGNLEPSPVPDFSELEQELNLLDFADVKGQSGPRRALEIAAAGNHNILMIGSPGTGKSMLAARLPGIIPPMTPDEILETSRIHSVLGMLNFGKPILSSRPFRSPHHTTSDIGLIGGGRDPRPGEISLAHNGVLFLDEFPEFKRSVLEVLRQPLENGSITISRASGSCTFPADFMLCAAMNPCPCGRGKAELGCTCTHEEIRKYQKKISGPLLDRIDIVTEVNQLKPDELIQAPTGESSAVIRERVIAARKIQQQRFADCRCRTNARMGSRELQQFCRLSSSGEKLLRSAIERLRLSPRAYDRILKVSRTIADLKGLTEIDESCLIEATGFRRFSLSGEF